MYYNDYSSFTPIYSQLPPNDYIFHNQDGVIIPFKKSWKSVMIRFSGGADSTLLAYLVCKIINLYNLDCSVSFTSYTRRWASRPWASYVAKNVYENFTHYFPSMNINRYFGFVPPSIEDGEVQHNVPYKDVDRICRFDSGERIIMREYDYYLMHTHKIDASFWGINANPPFQISANSNATADSIRDIHDRAIDFTDIFNHHLEYNGVIVAPLIYVSKEWVTRQYYYEKILELYNITRSCGGDIRLHKNISSVIPSFRHYVEGMHVPVCNTCWWCHERKWGEEQLNKFLVSKNLLPVFF